MRLFQFVPGVSLGGPSPSPCASLLADVLCAKDGEPGEEHRPAATLGEEHRPAATLGEEHRPAATTWRPQAAGGELPECNAQSGPPPALQRPDAQGFKSGYVPDAAQLQPWRP